MSFGISYNEEILEIGIVSCVIGKIFRVSELLDIDDAIGDGEADG